MQLSVGIDDPMDRGGRHMSLMCTPMSQGTVSCLKISMASLTWRECHLSMLVDELGIVPQDIVILLMRVLDNVRFVVVTFAAMGFVFVESGREVPASLTKVHFAT